MADQTNVTQDTTLWDDDRTKAVSVTTGADGVNRLDIDAVTTDILSKSGLTESFSDSVVLSFGNPEGTNIFERNIKTLMENSCPSDISLSATLSSTVDVVQIFRASADSFAGCAFFASVPAGSILEIDDFDTNVTTNWTSSNTARLTVSQETTIVAEGTGSMNVRVKNTAAVGEAVTRSYVTAQDYSSYDDEVTLYYYADNIANTWYIEFEDSTGEILRSPEFGSSVANSWEFKTISFNNFTEQGVGTTDLSDITDIRFVNATATPGDCYFDLLSVQTISAPETIDFELYDFGTTANPTNISAGTRLTEDDGSTTSVPVTVAGTNIKRYSLTFHRGINDQTTGKPLTVGNYYGLRFKTTGTIYFWGANTQVYSSGKTYTELSSTGAFTDTTNSMGFQTFYAPNICYVVGIGFFLNNDALNSSFNLGIKKYGDLNADDQIACGLEVYGEKHFVSQFARPELFEKGDRFFILVDKDGNSTMTKGSLFIQAITAPLTRYN